MKYENQRLLYLIQHSNNQMFKIGIATDNSRFKQIDSDYSINWDKSLYFKGENEDIIFMEKILHRLFFKDRLDEQQGTGGTEWFDIVCLEKVVDSLLFNIEQSNFDIGLEANTIKLQEIKEKEVVLRLQKPKQSRYTRPTYTPINQEYSVNYIPSKKEIEFMKTLIEESERFIFYTQDDKAFYYSPSTKETIEISELDYVSISNMNVYFNKGHGGFNLFSNVRTEFKNGGTNLNDYFNQEHKEFCTIFNKPYKALDTYPSIIVNEIYRLFPVDEFKEIVQSLETYEEIDQIKE